MPTPSNRLRSVPRSATYAVLDLVRTLRSQGHDVVDLGGGEPDFDTPRHISDEAVAAIRGGLTHYTPSRGLPELLEAVSEKLAKDNDVLVDPATDIVVTPSAKHALFVSLLAVLDPGDEVVVPTPSWVSYAAMAGMLGARPSFVELDSHSGFRLTRAALDRALTPRTKAVLVNTPNNPTGRVLDHDELSALVSFAVDNDLFVVSDEIYEKIRYVDRRHVSPAALPGGAVRTLTVNGFSKAHAMTGWRLGYVAGPTEVIGELLKAQQHTVGCAGSFVQRGGVAALTGSPGPVETMVAEYTARRDLLVSRLSQLPGVGCAAPEGALYVFPDITGVGLGDSAAFTTWLLERAQVAVTPGSAFGPGGEGHVRLSFANSLPVLDEALDRIERALHASR
ncbi:aspartate aminotransferase [Parafrankia irregularis]|uniref:Aminotransferase n=1 Tax=Parafrankia irregularis TaxID=795642 RepID=A0A0S4QHK3_9ACTN|nr:MULTISPECIES: pyridoxal phosphate-dependent aminotransferase [Parafrankia]MBE3204171.1 pyridoxal phosphate-dependent aminotransferase [Parafrankia sp. CH37]CUU54951.1 aspartate aminotransferase [Parafrankia irregularis]